MIVNHIVRTACQRGGPHVYAFKPHTIDIHHLYHHLAGARQLKMLDHLLIRTQGNDRILGLSAKAHIVVGIYEYPEVTRLGNAVQMIEAVLVCSGLVPGVSGDTHRSIAHRLARLRTGDEAAEHTLRLERWSDVHGFRPYQRTRDIRYHFGFIGLRGWCIHPHGLRSIQRCPTEPRSSLGS